jgi:hypothetical protein
MNEAKLLPPRFKKKIPVLNSLLLAQKFAPETNLMLKDAFS